MIQAFDCCVFSVAAEKQHHTSVFSVQWCCGVCGKLVVGAVGVYM